MRYQTMQQSPSALPRYNVFPVTRFRHIGNEIRDEREMQHTQGKKIRTQAYSTSPFSPTKKDTERQI